MKANIEVKLNNTTFKIKRIRWNKNSFDVTGKVFHYGEVWIRRQRFYTPEGLRKESKETILEHFQKNPQAFKAGGWYEYTTKP